MRFLFIPFIIFSCHWQLFAQCKTYRISPKGDTLNCLDLKNKRQGFWVIQTPPLRGEPGYTQEGIFLNDKKEGKWKKFNLMGDKIADENFKWDNLNGRCLYFNNQGLLEREESWLAKNPDKPFDTIDVPDPKNPNLFEKVVVQIEGSSAPHGIWRYYDPQYGQVYKTEEYFMGRLKQPGQTEVYGKPKTSTQKDTTTVEKPKPKIVAEFDKKSKGKKNKVRDGRTGG